MAMAPVLIVLLRLALVDVAGATKTLVAATVGAGVIKAVVLLVKAYEVGL